MLIGLSPLLGPDLLYALRAMGHGDEIALVDGNYPAATDARRLIRADGVGLIAMLRAVLAILPVESAARASLNNNAAQAGAVHHDIDAACAASGQNFTITPLDGSALYPRIKAAYAIVATSEGSHYANVILRKGAMMQPPQT